MGENTARKVFEALFIASPLNKIESQLQEVEEEKYRNRINNGFIHVALSLTNVAFFCD